MKSTSGAVGITIFLIFILGKAFPQPCTSMGQTPPKAFPVCGTTTFHQSSVPLCRTSNLYVPGCPPGGADYGDKNPFYYKFTCFIAGTLGFIINPLTPNEDIDWQLYDVTGHNPNDLYTDPSLVVSGNWSGSYGPTGASAAGVSFIQCASNPADSLPTFAEMPWLVAGHNYILLVSHWTDTQNGYDLSFGGGTAVITDPAPPHLLEAKADCDGPNIILKLNKKFRCSSLTSSGSEFSLSPSATAITSVIATNCSSQFEFDEVTLKLASPLPSGNYQLVINNGTDNNTLIDFCDAAIPAGESVSFSHFILKPIFADSIERLNCTSDSLKIYFPKKIICSNIASDGSGFSVSGSPVLSIQSAYGNCVDGKTDYVVLKFSSTIYRQGNYLLSFKAGTDSTIFLAECNPVIPVQTIPFTTADTVSARFSYTAVLGCRNNTVNFMHNGDHSVNSWNWIVNNSPPITTQNLSVSFPASSVSQVQLSVSNGVCIDTASEQLVMDNEVKAGFDMTDLICPEDGLKVSNKSKGPVDIWKWQFANYGISNLKDPALYFWPLNNRESYYTVKLIAYNSQMRCGDTVQKSLTVLNNCQIAVPSAFTPNGDGLNDYLSPHNALKADNLEFKVYNRWGELIFFSRDWRQKWDGRIKGVLQNSGIYVWMLRYTHRDTGQQVFQKGTVMLIR